MTAALLDVNTLLALAWPNHQFHGSARAWFRNRSGPWCTCSLTQLGFVRLSSNPAFTNQARRPDEALALLESMCAHAEHRFIAETPDHTNPTFRRLVERMMGHQQVTDGFLLAMAASQSMELATFDRRLVPLAGEDAAVLLLST